MNNSIEIVSAETFKALALVHSSSSLMGKDPDGVGFVRATTYAGKLFTTLAYHWWSLSRCTVEAYELMEPDRFTGPTTVNGFNSAMIRGQWMDTDFTGLLVQVDGANMVCARRQRFEAGLPTGEPMSFRDALAYSDAQKSLGWRTKYRARHPQVFSVNGHPVFKYQDPASGHCDLVLLWKHDHLVEEIRLDRSAKLDGVPGHVMHACLTVPA
ncbi:hypothetical protein [Acidovorax sp. sic0104]|uniref:hypothetical protein n=1 Tax=Acidovorax sp. sic0104 TaxID=2854784 RepID=UPI001C458CAB|nr:hypothetical protein [Acidovorax sp. sic0104]MBV7542155.1 hypothetical protein [Acidovorax sp. sic0104]